MSFAPIRTILAVCMSGALGVFAAQAQELSKAEQIYADLAKLPKAERAKEIEAGARREGTISIVQTLREDLGNGQIQLFANRYPFLKVDWTASLGSADGAQRLYSEEVAGRHLTDAINVAIVDMSDLLLKNMIARYPTPERDRIYPKFRDLFEPEGRFTLTFWDVNGMVYNTNLVPPDRVPKQWMDLCDPFFKGNFSFDPVLARQVAGFYTLMGDKTLEFFRCLGRNKPIVQRGFSQRFALMAAGDHMIEADSYLYQAYAEKKKNPQSPVAIVPTGTSPPLASFGGVGINRQTQHPYATALFVDWMVSDESQNYLAANLRGPVAAKHPYLTDDSKFVVMPDLPKNIIDPLVDEWRRNIEGTK